MEVAVTRAPWARGRPGPAASFPLPDDHPRFVQPALLKQESMKILEVELLGVECEVRLVLLHGGSLVCARCPLGVKNVREPQPITKRFLAKEDICPPVACCMQSWHCSAPQWLHPGHSPPPEGQTN